VPTSRISSGAMAHARTPADRRCAVHLVPPLADPIPLPEWRSPANRRGRKAGHLLIVEVVAAPGRHSGPKSGSRARDQDSRAKGEKKTATSMGESVDVSRKNLRGPSFMFREAVTPGRGRASLFQVRKPSRCLPWRYHRPLGSSPSE
jgi:hypothetical protein